MRTDALERAAAVLRPALGLPLVINLVPLGLLLVDVRTMLLRLYTHWELSGVGGLVVGGGLLVPLWVLVAGGRSLFVLGAATCIVLGSLVIRLVIIKLPHPA